MRIVTRALAVLAALPWGSAPATAAPADAPVSVWKAPRHRGRPGGCPPLSRGSFVIDAYQLYPENADWDEDSCLVYFGALWNATVAIYDPYADAMVRILEFAGVSNTGTEHIGGVAWDRFTGLITILVDSAAPWATGGTDVSGDNLVIKWDPRTQQTLWTANLTATTEGAYGGFQDIETDAAGFTYVVGTFPASILRVSPDGDVVPWFGPTPADDTTAPGLGGLVALGDDGRLLLANDAGNGSLYRMDAAAPRAPRVLVQVPIRPDVRYNDTDAIYAPPRYGGRVLLVASHDAGLQVLASRDARWTHADHLGTIANPPDVPPGSATTAAVQMGPDAVYMIDDWIGDAWVPGQVAGNRSAFPMPDVTAQIDALLRAW